MTRFLLCLPFLAFFALVYPRPPLPAPPESVTPPTPAVAPPTLASLPDPDPVRFLEMALARYEREVTGYRVVLAKRERVGTQLRPEEVVHADFREAPHGVLMRWEKGAGMARAVLFVAGENGGKMLARPIIPVPFFPVVARAVDSPEVKNAGRYTADKFGIKTGMVRALTAWRQRQAEGNLHVAYEGIVPLEKAGGRPCHKLHRTRIDPPEEDGVADVVLYFDQDTWLQIGSVLRDSGGEIIGEYYFNVLELNPTFGPDDFSRKRLEKL